MCNYFIQYNRGELNFVFAAQSKKNKTKSQTSFSANKLETIHKTHSGPSFNRLPLIYVALMNHLQCVWRIVQSYDDTLLQILTNEKNTLHL